MRSTLLQAIVTAAAPTLALVLPAVPPAVAAGVPDPELAELVASLLPSCVNITTTRYKEVQLVQGKSVLVQDAETDKRHAYGSGFIITTDGYVVTNKHVTRNGISYKITLADSRQLPADLVAQAPAYDIALMKIRSDETWRPVKLGDSDTLHQGDAVIAIGNPLDYQSTVTTGIISALNRDAHWTEFDNYIQTDAAINEGNSGGPLFNRKGEVIGVNTAIQTAGGNGGNIGIGLAIPVNDAKFVVRHMHDPLATGSKDWRPAYLGASVQALTPSLASAYGLPGPWGSIVASTDKGSPAAEAGLRAGDIITGIDGKDLKDSRALMRAIVESPSGTTIKLDVWRDGRQEAINVTLIDLPAGWSLPAYLEGGGVSPPNIPPEALDNFGLQLAALTPDLRTKFHIDRNAQGVVVTAVAIGSKAADHDIDAGMVILKVRDAAVVSPEDVIKYVNQERQQKRPSVPMLVSNAGALSWVAFSLK
jgi:serine protease Do